jgi:hypothetical protein
MRTLDVRVIVNLKVDVESPSWDGHEEAERKVLDVVNHLFNNTVDVIKFESCEVDCIQG